MTHKIHGLDETIAGRCTTVRERWQLGKARALWVTLEIEFDDPASTERLDISRADWEALHDEAKENGE
jgi:hypothetical protein